ncbi:MAG: YdcF family protein [Clostridiales bacterium]|nr:YdcF family protein [Clostridiales bacterium]
MKFLRILLILAGLALVADTIFVFTRSNFNLGVILPAFFGLPLLALGLFLPKMTRGFGALMKWAMTGGLCLALVILTVCGILMISAVRDEDTVEADALIVLGAGLRFGDRISFVLRSRLDVAADYLIEHPDCIVVVSGGQGPDETVTEAFAMEKYLVEVRGIAPERIIQEDRATSTAENFAFSIEVLNAHYGEDAASLRLAYVTTGFHVYRAGRVANGIGLPMPGLASRDYPYIAFNNFLRESVGICVYALRGEFAG